MLTHSLERFLYLPKARMISKTYLHSSTEKPPQVLISAAADGFARPDSKGE